MQRALEKQTIDPTLLRYVGTVIAVLANVALVVASLGYFRIETTTRGRLAVGTAWGGLLSNFAEFWVDLPTCAPAERAPGGAFERYCGDTPATQPLRLWPRRASHARKTCAASPPDRA